MKRGVFLATSAAAEMIVATRSPALALLPVFDAANYAQAINNLAKTTIISQKSIETAATELKMYNDLVSQGRLNIELVWPQISSFLQQLATNANVSLGIPPTAASLLARFAQAYPQWQPNQPYSQLYTAAENAIRTAIGNTEIAAQAEMSQVNQQANGLNALTSTAPKSEADMLGLGDELAYILNQNLLGLRNTMAAQNANQGDYYNALLAERQAQRHEPGSVALSAVLSRVPKQLLPANGP